jgi:hypothetical protein
MSVMDTKIEAHQFPVPIRANRVEVKLAKVAARDGESAVLEQLVDSLGVVLADVRSRCPGSIRRTHRSPLPIAFLPIPAA